MATPPPMEGNTFIYNESSWEMAWFFNQEQILTKGMEGLFPESFDLSNVKRILDVACGSGGWVLDVAQEYPEIEVVGFDISNDMINYARAHAKARGLQNAHLGS